MRLLSLPQDENQVEGVKISYSLGNSSGNAYGTKHPNKERLRMHFKSGRNAGIGVCAPQGVTLKVMVQNKIQVRRNSFY
jgi:hypothetical protein